MTKLLSLLALALLGMVMESLIVTIPWSKSMKNILLLVFVSLQILCATSALGNNRWRAFEIGLHRGPVGDWPKESCVEASLGNNKFSIEKSSKNYVLDRLIAEKLTEMLERGVLRNSPPLHQVFVSYPGFGSMVFMAEDRSVCKE